MKESPFSFDPGYEVLALDINDGQKIWGTLLDSGHEIRVPPSGEKELFLLVNLEN